MTNDAMLRVLFDQGVPVPLRKALSGFQFDTAFERGWSTLQNGELIAAAQAEYDVFVSTDKNLRYQQDLRNRTVAILILPTTRWPVIQSHAARIQAALERIEAGAYVELSFDT